LKEWLSYLSPVSRVLLDSLLRFQTNPDTADLTVTQRTAAAHAIVYFADRVNTLLEALLAAEPFQFKIFYDGLGLDELDSEKGDSELIANVLHHALMAFPTSGRLFNIPFETENALNSGEISLALRKAFHDNGYPLAQGASVSNVVASLRWLVTDAESVYVVEKGQRELNVYESEALLDRKAIKQVNAAIALLLWKKDGDESGPEPILVLRAISSITSRAAGLKLDSCGNVTSRRAIRTCAKSGSSALENPAKISSL
jgi:hypothetical protein